MCSDINGAALYGDIRIGCCLQGGAAHIFLSIYTVLAPRCLLLLLICQSVSLGLWHSIVVPLGAAWPVDLFLYLCFASAKEKEQYKVLREGCSDSCSAQLQLVALHTSSPSSSSSSSTRLTRWQITSDKNPHTWLILFPEHLFFSIFRIRCPYSGCATDNCLTVLWCDVVTGWYSHRHVGRKRRAQRVGNSQSEVN